MPQLQLAQRFEPCVLWHSMEGVVEMMNVINLRDEELRMCVSAFSAATCVNSFYVTPSTATVASKSRNQDGLQLLKTRTLSATPATTSSAPKITTSSPKSVGNCGRPGCAIHDITWMWRLPDVQDSLQSVIRQLRFAHWTMQHLEKAMHPQKRDGIRHGPSSHIDACHAAVLYRA